MQVTLLFLQCSVTNLLYTHTYFHFGVPMEQIRCAGHTTVFTVYTIGVLVILCVCTLNFLQCVLI